MNRENGWKGRRSEKRGRRKMEEDDGGRLRREDPS